jgi:hypothetical protein
MKNGFLKLVRTVMGPLALVVAMAAFSPVSALAAGRGGFGGHASGGRGFSGGGHAYSAPARGFNGGGRGYYGGRGGYYGGRGGYYGGRYYGPGFGVGVYAPYGYGYAAPVCGGFYDQAGIWQVSPGCAVPYGY